MHRTILSLAAAASLIATAALLPSRADAMSVGSVGTAPAIELAIADMALLDDVAYVCRHRYYTSFRTCRYRAVRTCRHLRYDSRRICRYR